MRRRRFSSIGRIFQIAFAVVLFILLLLLILWYQEGLHSFKPEEVTYYYIAGQKILCTNDAKFVESQNGIMVNDDGQKMLMDSAPIYYQNEKKLTLSHNYMYMRPLEEAGNVRVNTFTSITEKNGRSTFSYQGKSVSVESGFLYDGDNTYVFLEPVTIEVGPVEIPLPVLSYVRVEYKTVMEYHNSDTEKFEFCNLDNLDVTAKFNSGYELDLGKDIIRIDGREAILYDAVDNLTVIDMK